MLVTHALNNCFGSDSDLVSLVPWHVTAELPVLAGTKRSLKKMRTNG